MISREQALDLFNSPDLIGIGMEADQVRRKLHPEGIVSYIIDRNINYTNFCTEYCSFCAFYRPMGHKEGYILSKEVIFDKIRETIELGGTGILMQGGLHPDLKIEWYEDLLRSIKQRFDIWCHCFSAPEIINIADVSGLSLRDTIARLRDAGLDSIPGGGAEILDDSVRYRISRLKCSTQDWIDVHRTAHALGMRTTATMMFGAGENHRASLESLRNRAPDSGRHRRIHGIHSVVLPARIYLARPLHQGRSDGGRIPQDAGALARLPGQHPEHSGVLGNARPEGLPDWAYALAVTMWAAS